MNCKLSSVYLRGIHGGYKKLIGVRNSMIENFIYETLAVMSVVILLFCVFFSDVADFCISRPGRIVFTVVGVMIMALAILGMGSKERRLAVARERRNRNEQGHIDRQAV